MRYNLGGRRVVALLAACALPLLCLVSDVFHAPPLPKLTPLELLPSSGLLIYHRYINHRQGRQTKVPRYATGGARDGGFHCHWGFP